MSRAVRGVPFDRLSNRVTGALYRGGVLTLEDLVACPEEHVRYIVNIGRGAMSELRALLASEGREFAAPRTWEGCECPACVVLAERGRLQRRFRGPYASLELVFQEEREKAARLARDPIPDNVVPFRPKPTEEEAAP